MQTTSRSAVEPASYPTPRPARRVITRVAGERTYYGFQRARGYHNGAAATHDSRRCFFDESCYRHYLTRLQCCLSAYRLSLHTYVLLPGEVHLLVSAFSGEGVARLLRSVANGYREYFANRFQRRCLLADARSGIIRLTGDDRVVDYQKLIELAPLRAGLVEHVGEYPWSGYAINAFGGHGPLLTAHPRYRALLRQTGRSFAGYRDFIATPFNQSDQSRFQLRLGQQVQVAAATDEPEQGQT